MRLFIVPFALFATLTSCKIRSFNKTIRPTLENVVRPELANDDERRAFEVIWKNMKY
jgi:hypothetical protein